MSGLEEFHCEEQSSEFTYKFEAGEKVLCFHGPLIYEAKCQQVRICEETKKPEYLIHYFGWNKSYDEWVAESRILKFNESNVKKQKELERALPKVKERKFRRKGVSSECKESKNSDSSSQSSSSNSSSHSGSSNVLSEEISQPRLVIERHLTPDESTPENSIRSELKEDGNGETNDEQEHIKQENNGGDDECVVDIKIENESITGYFEGDVKSSDKESKRISQRRSSRLSVESRTSSQELETPIKEEFDVSDSSQNFIDERFENEKDPTNSDDQAERGFPLTQSNVKLKNSLIDRVELEKPIDTAAKIERRRCSAKSDNGSSSSETGSDKPKRRSSVDTKKSVSEEAQQKSSARNDPKVDLLNMDPRKSITPRPANSIFRERRLFKLPKKLRTYLTDDWDFVCRQHKLCCLPAENTVEKIFKHFIKCGSMHDGVKKEKIIEIMNLLRSYFDVALGQKLLHKFERYQYSNMLKLHPSKKMSELYGGPQLLRLLFTMEENEEWCDMEKEDFDVFSKVMQLLVDFLALKADVYCSAHVYYFATVDYHREDNLL